MPANVQCTSANHPSSATWKGLAGHRRQCIQGQLGESPGEEEFKPLDKPALVTKEQSVSIEALPHSLKALKAVDIPLHTEHALLFHPPSPSWYFMSTPSGQG